MTNELVRISPAQAGISTQAIHRFLDGARQKGIELHSFMLLRHGQVCAEGWWKPYAPAYVHPMYSFSKSLTSTAIGFAVQEGLLSLEDRLADIFSDCLPESPSENLQKATLRDLLTMSCGHETEPAGWEGSWIERFLSHPFVYAPGTMFQYNTAGTNLLCASLFRKSGQQLTAFLRPRLLDKIGIGEISCAAMEDGTEIGGAGYRLRTEDMARFMLFILQRGSWNGEQLLGEGWFDLATTRQIATDTPVYNGKGDWGMGYGFQFWQCKPQGVFRADGLWGQFGIAMPEKDALLVITEATGHTQDTLDLVWDTLLSAFEDAPLPEDREAQARLCYRLEKLTLASLPSDKLNPWETAKRFEKTYLPLPGKEAMFFMEACTRFLHSNETMRLQSLALRFFENEAVLCLTEDGVTSEIPIGLCGEYAAGSYRGEKIAGIGYFRSHYLFEAELRGMETAHGIRLLFRFEGEKLTISRCKTLLGYGDEPTVPDLLLQEAPVAAK